MKISSIFIAATLMTISNSSIASPVLYTFEGTVSGFQSYHQDYDISDFDVVIGETNLKYVFEVDVEAGQSSYTNTAGTWSYFYSDLIEGSVINDGNIYGDYSGFNWYRLDGPNVGQVSSNLANVRITSFESDTQNWRVQDWKIGQSFSSTDLACYADGGGGCAVYAYGNVMLTSISTVPVPASAWLFSSGLLALFGVTRRKKA